MRHILLTCFYFRRTRLRISKYLSALSSFLPKKKGKEGKNTHIVIIKLDFKGRLENLISRNFFELLSAALVNKLLQASEFPLVSRVDESGRSQRQSVLSESKMAASSSEEDSEDSLPKYGWRVHLDNIFSHKPQPCYLPRWSQIPRLVGLGWRYYATW